MIKGAVGKALGLGRTTALPVVLAVMLVLVFGASPASAHKGYKGVLHLGHKNTIAKVTTLVGKVATGPALVMNNPSGGSALDLQVNAGQAPLTVNADAGKATNLDADKLDGKEAADFLGKMEKAADSDTLDGINSSGFYQAGSKAADSDKLDGKDSTQFAADANQNGKADAAEQADNASNLGEQPASAYQRRVSSSCSPNSSIRIVHDNGTVTCESNAANADKLDNIDSKWFVKGSGLVQDSAVDISPGTANQRVLRHMSGSPYVEVSYSCPTDLATNGTLRITNLGDEQLNLFSDNGGENPNQYGRPNKGGSFSQQAAFGGEHITWQLQGEGVGTIEVFSVHRTSSLSTGTDNKCHVQVQGLFTH